MAQKDSNSFLSNPPDYHHSSDDVYWRRGGTVLTQCTLQAFYHSAIWTYSTGMLSHYNLHFSF